MGTQLTIAILSAFFTWLVPKILDPSVGVGMRVGPRIIRAIMPFTFVRRAYLENLEHRSRCFELLHKTMVEYEEYRKNELLKDGARARKWLQ